VWLRPKLAAIRSAQGYTCNWIHSPSGYRQSWPDVFNHGIRALKQSRRLCHQTKSNHGLGLNKNDEVRFRRRISSETSRIRILFSIKENAQARWHYTPKDAERTQIHMIENAFEAAKRTDQQKGLEIMMKTSTFER
jgi:hypothetical protein